jgi:hypothetical protein
MPTTYFIGGAVLGQTPTLPSWDGLGRLAGNLAFFCPGCGKVWGRIHNPSTRGWHTLDSSCPSCPSYRGEVPGSFLLPWHPSQLDELPREALRREFNLLYTHFERTSQL